MESDDLRARATDLFALALKATEEGRHEYGQKLVIKAGRLLDQAVALDGSDVVTASSRSGQLSKRLWRLSQQRAGDPLARY